MRRWVALLLAVLLAVSLAGCGGGKGGANKVRLGDGQQVSLDLPKEQQPDKDDIRGAISGIVVNDGIYPVPGAHVQVKGRDIANTTDETGRFVFEAMPPGIYVLVVTKAGHDEGLGTVNVPSGDVAKSVLLLPRSPYLAPYHMTLEIEEFHSQVDGAQGYSRDHIVPFDLRPASMILEATWDPLPVPSAGDPLEYSASSARNPNNAVEGSGANPLRVEVDPTIFPSNDYAARLDVWPTAMLPPESKGTIYVTYFYVTPAPQGWSFVGGDT